MLSHTLLGHSSRFFLVTYGLVLFAACAAPSSQCAVGFASALNSPLPLTSSNGVAIGDVDGALGRDAVVTSPNTNEVLVLLNDGAGNLALAATSSLAVSGQPSLLTLGDLDGINGDDLVVTQNFPPRALVFHNDGTGRFTPGPVLDLGSQVTNSVLALDLDGRNGLDIVVSVMNGVAWFLADGAGGFGPRRFRSIPSFPDIASGDFDGTNGPDLAVAITTGSFSGAVHVLLNDGAGNLLPAPGSPYASATAPARIAVGELDGAPGDDIAWVHQHYFNGMTVEALLHRGGGTFAYSAIATLPPMLGVDDIQIADVDGNGSADVLTTHGVDGIRVFRNDGTASFQLSGESPIGPQGASQFGVGELDGHPGVDLVVSYGRGLRVLHNRIGMVGIAGENRLGVLDSGGAQLAPTGIACVALDLTAGGTFAFDVEARTAGMTVALLLRGGACATDTSRAVALGAIPPGHGYAIPVDCATGSNRILQVTGGLGPIQAVSLGSTTLDPGRGIFAAGAQFAVPASMGIGTVTVQAVLLDATVPGGFVLTNALAIGI